MYSFISHSVLFKIENPLILLSKLLPLFNWRLLPIMVEFRIKPTISLQLVEDSTMRYFIETPMTELRKKRPVISSFPPGCKVSPHNSKVSVEQKLAFSNNVALVETTKTWP